MAKTKIYEYKGYVGIEVGDKFVNPESISQLDYVVELSEVEISQNALSILKKLRKGRGAFGYGDLMCFGTIFAWAGGFYQVITQDYEVNKDYQPSLLEPYVTEIETPKEFMDYIDSSTVV